ncbi:glycoside hydrolase family 1 protein [Breznakia pachnodae]|uniref:6-phospho-beta-glucosidase n=1 Tax=Breznakia pachnodae TaxID=265178 RepID=A0ABU0E8I2_9FIRM|nr:glycoside hydrolase family 1 protein [Breznakia pachnodae]MDQ0363036.1 6-phospho-beta-glucosidase [Breznakia pachnodae]
MTKEFLWGGSTSAFQFEGGYNEGGKSTSTTDVRNTPEGIADSKVASDHYHHVKEDIELMANLGIKIYRFSFNWARVIKDDGSVNEKGIEFYNTIIDSCIELGIEPFPTLYHFEMPQNLVDRFGGWKSRKCIDAFTDYAKACFLNFGDRVKRWGTINEQLIVSAASDLNGNKENNSQQKIIDMYTMSYHMSVAEKKVIKLFRELIPQGRIGPVCTMQIAYPQTSKPEDMIAAANAEDFLMYMFLDMSVYGTYPKSVQNYLKDLGLFYPLEKDKELLESNTSDFIGLNYYTSTCIKAKPDEFDDSKLPPFYRNSFFTLGENKELKKTKWMEYGIDPMGLYLGVRKLYEKYRLPMIITENGYAMSEKLDNGKIHDIQRISYLDEHIRICEKLVEEGYPLEGYCPWSLFDLVSSHQGFSKRYGLIYIDRTDQDVKECKRIPKDSYYWYQKIIKNNGIIEENI